MRRGRNWESLPNQSKEALEMIATKVARILNGDATDPEHGMTSPAMPDCGPTRLRLVVQKSTLMHLETITQP